MSEHSGYPGAPPGWYDDPAGGPGQRWWDGYAWTRGHRAPPAAAAAAVRGRARPRRNGPPAQMAPWAAASERLNTFTTTQRGRRRAAHGAGWHASPWRSRASTSSWASCCSGRTRTSCAPPATSSASTGTPRRPASRRPRTTPRPTRGRRSASSSDGAHDRRRDHRLHVAAPGRVGRARRSASRRGTRRPGASGCWFVPVVNLWMPYGAMRDCLPPDHPQRPRVLHWWIALLARRRS